MKISSFTPSLAPFSLNLERSQNGSFRLTAAQKCFENLAHQTHQLSTEIQNQLNHTQTANHYFNDLSSEYSIILQDLSIIGRQAINLINTGHQNGIISVDQAETLDRINNRAYHLIEKLKNIRDNIIHRRLYGKDEFDDNNSSPPLIMVH